MRRPAPATVRWLILAALLVFWELMPRTGIIPELFLPPLSKTLAVLVKDWRKYASELAVTLYEVAFAMLIACGVGILAGALVGGVALLRNLLLPVFSSLYAVPIVILYPIFTAWFGIGSESKIIFAGVYGFFPVMLSTAAGIRTIDAQLLLAARSMGATLPQQITRVIIPASIPTVLTGLRLGGALTIIGVVVSRDADLVGRHRLRGDALPHHPRLIARVRRDRDDPAALDPVRHAGARGRAAHHGVADRGTPAEGSEVPQVTGHARARAGVSASGRRRIVDAVFDLTLSFDNGPTPDVTPHVLDVLARRGIRSTFFVIGEKLAQPGNRALAERAHAEGHWIGNHTWSHSLPFGLMDGGGRERRVRPHAAAIGALVHPHRFFRPYGQGGNLDRRLLSRPVLDHLAQRECHHRAVERAAARLAGPDGWVERALDQIAAQPVEPDGAARPADRRDAPPRPLPRPGGGARRPHPAGVSAGLFADGGWRDEISDRRVSERA